MGNPFSTFSHILYSFTDIWILERIPANSRILDIGCGIGSFTHKVVTHCAPRELIGIDIDEYCLKAATRLLAGHSVRIERLDAESHSLLQCLGKFDVILARNTFHHFQEKNDFLLRVRDELLTDGGRFLLLDLDARANYAAWGVAIAPTLIRCAISSGLTPTLRIILDSRAFLLPSIRCHRREDRNRLQRQGWYYFRDIKKKLHDIFPDATVCRLGAIAGIGGCYAMDYLDSRSKKVDGAKHE